MTPQRRTGSAADTRAGILDAAERLFAERGFDATPTSAIAEAAGVPKGLLFYYFPTKKELLRALVAERMTLGPLDIDAFAEPGDPARSLLNLTAKIRELEKSSHVLGIIVSREQHTHPEVLTALLEHRDRLQALIERVLTASSPVRPTAARLRSAARAWIGILALGSDHATEAARTELTALADFVCDGLLPGRRASATG
ncbi:TetR/AcrR family transcriptional regulator [Humibacter sp. RRB41]|uniref:TetR/AcrR family transcriptional regulator n=1 Tax=Humibacter sp. RRB41 TaxID=2919946 RepID=UPI001FAA529D|nr:TetR/AcrR family transcriptional regulator [Humibacter sp. RRB41]